MLFLAVCVQDSLTEGELYILLTPLVLQMTGLCNKQIHGDLSRGYRSSQDKARLKKIAGGKPALVIMSRKHDRKQFSVVKEFIVVIQNNVHFTRLLAPQLNLNVAAWTTRSQDIQCQIIIRSQNAEANIHQNFVRK
jgi:hypothetical protein